MRIEVVSYLNATDAIQSVRYQVFQVEQGVDPALEFDEFDPIATHVLGYVDCQAVATARIRQISPALVKIERVAVLSGYRGQGLGREIMAAAIAVIAERRIPEIKINAQLHAQSFYQKLGFQPQGDVFDEAGIPHIEMRMRLVSSLT